MNNPFFPSMAEVGERIEHSTHLLLGLDFDGTLAPLVDEPAKAILQTPMRRVLWSLAGRKDVSLVITSGRRIGDIQERVGIAGIVYCGNHGLEIHGPDFSFVEPTAAARAPELKKIYAELVQSFREISGVLVEDKDLTLSVHQRHVAAGDREKVWLIVYAAWEKAKDLFDLTRGNMVYELRPRGGWNRGAALKWIRDQLDCPDALMMYVGDDATGKEVFALLSDGVTIKIGDTADSEANYMMAGPAEVQSYLEWVDQLLSDKTRAMVQSMPVTEASISLG